MAKIYYVGDWAVLTGPVFADNAVPLLPQGPRHLQLRKVAEGGPGVDREAPGRIRAGLGFLQQARPGDLHFAPTARARDNLVREGAPPEDVYVTGNTVVDALAGVPHRELFDDPALESVDWAGRRVVLVTGHRRESLRDHLHDLCRAFKRLVHEHPEVHLVFPVHLNPRVREVVFADLRGHERITLLDPLSYPDLLEVMRRSHFVMSDSGGIQEEAPSFRKPILILRTVTERPEVDEAGFVTLVGTDPDLVVGTANRLLRDETLYRRMTSGVNPFGDGTAAARIIRIIAEPFVLFAGLDDVEKIKSIVPAVGVLTDIWIEEATETERGDVKDLYKRQRGGDEETRKRMILSFNPILQSHWIYAEWFQSVAWSDEQKEYKDDELSILKTTYKDNAYLTTNDHKDLENEKDRYRYNVYTLGNWGILGHVIFTNWRVEDLSGMTDQFTNHRNGLDFGFSSDPL